MNKKRRVPIALKANLRFNLMVVTLRIHWVMIKVIQSNISGYIRRRLLVFMPPIKAIFQQKPYVFHITSGVPPKPCVIYDFNPPTNVYLFSVLLIMTFY